jgi:hypothetical protein
MFVLNIAYASGELVHIPGYDTSEEVEALIVVADETGLQLRGVLFAGILLASLRCHYGCRQLYDGYNGKYAFACIYGYL